MRSPGVRCRSRAVAAQAQGAVAVYVTHSETSTGVVHDVRAIAEALRPTGALLVVDAVSSLGGVELRWTSGVSTWSCPVPRKR